MSAPSTLGSEETGDALPLTFGLEMAHDDDAGDDSWQFHGAVLNIGQGSETFLYF